MKEGKAAKAKAAIAGEDKASGVEQVVVLPLPDEKKRRPADEFERRLTDVLPDGWRVVEKIRKIGKSAGVRDKYFQPPPGVESPQLRSLAAVLRFVARGGAAH